jgi:hypothetical protein
VPRALRSSTTGLFSFFFAVSSNPQDISEEKIGAFLQEEFPMKPSSWFVKTSSGQLSETTTAETMMLVFEN